jgi:cytoskeletal protein RodZ
MGEEVRGVPEAAALAATDALAAERGSGIGHYLASQRRLRGISLDQLASLTKIPRRSLERLEAGSFDAAPDGFARGFVRTVAGALGLDPDQTVARLLAEPDEEEPDPRGGVGWRQRTLFARAALLAALILAVLGVWKLAVLWRAPSADPALPEVILRRDPVRELVVDEPASAEGARSEAKPSEGGPPQGGPPQDVPR